MALAEEVSPTFSDATPGSLSNFGLSRSFSDDSSFNVSEEQFTCSICQESQTTVDSATVKETLGCNHDICRGCLRKSVMLNQKRCPVCNTELSSLEIFRGTVNDREWIEAEKDKLWRDGGFLGIKCGNEACCGVATLEEHAQQPLQIRCARHCGASFCGRCRNPWIDWHRCEDLVQAEAAAQAQIHEERQIHEDQAALFLAEEQNRRRGCFAYCDRRRRRQDAGRLHPYFPQLQLRARATASALHQMDRSQEIVTKPCPRCRVETMRDGGCNIMGCTTCQAKWCFICGRGEEHGCHHYGCARS